MNNLHISPRRANFSGRQDSTSGNSMAAYFSLVTPKDSKACSWASILSFWRRQSFQVSPETFNYLARDFGVVAWIRYWNLSPSSNALILMNSLELVVESQPIRPFSENCWNLNLRKMQR
ncbi:hypothetical protein TNCV_914211 [Trichonephila clavipes]|nr:hypothetical protein TNCV_914211 [Trichonephila clavipes]